MAEMVRLADIDVSKETLDVHVLPSSIFPEQNYRIVAPARQRH